MGFCHGLATVGAVLSHLGRSGSIFTRGSGLESKEPKMSGPGEAWYRTCLGRMLMVLLSVFV